MNAAACQYVNDCATVTDSLPFTGYALGAVMALGILLIIGGLFIRRDR